MKTMLVKLGIRSSSLGLATRQTKADFIGAALQRDRDLRALQASRATGTWHDDQQISLLRDTSSAA